MKKINSFKGLAIKVAGKVIGKLSNFKPLSKEELGKVHEIGKIKPSDLPGKSKPVTIMIKGQTRPAPKEDHDGKEKSMENAPNKKSTNKKN